jgi:hypothetical protein
MAYELIKHDRPAAGLFYAGHAEQATFDVTLPPDQLPGMSWFADEITGALAGAAAGEGTILDNKIYYDPGAWWNCEYRVITTAHASPLLWTPIIITALVVIGIAIVAWILHSVEAMPWLGIGLIGLGVGAGAFGIAYLVNTARAK